MTAIGALLGDGVPMEFFIQLLITTCLCFVALYGYRSLVSKRAASDSKAKATATAASSAPATHLLFYSDAEGHRTERRITLTMPAHRDYNGEVYIRGYCHLRKSIRTFRRDRISLVADPITGEVIGSARKIFRMRGEADPEKHPDHDRIVRKAMRGLEVLAWIADAEDGIDEAEFDDINGFVASEAARMNSRIGGHDHEALRDMLADIATTRVHVVAAISAMTKRERESVLSVVEHWRAKAVADSRTAQRLGIVEPWLQGRQPLDG